MAAKSKKRLCKIENKLTKLDKLELNDVICSICQSIFVEPVTLPCYHDFCKTCFVGSIENNALCCPLCRLRIGSWLRSTKKQNALVNKQLWTFMKSKFSKEIDKKLNGEDTELPEDKPILRLSAPGEIRSEYEAELKRLRAERLQLEKKHLQETELLIKKLQEEETEAHKKYQERLKQDEILAQTIQAHHSQDLSSTRATTTRTQNVRSAAIKARLKPTKIDHFLFKKTVPAAVKVSPLLTDDNSSSTNSSTSKNQSTNKSSSPEIVPTYSKCIKNFFGVSAFWNKENGESSKTSETKVTKSKEETPSTSKTTKSEKPVQSLPVSLPYTGILQHKRFQENRNVETSSVDSMRQELCYFKPIEGTTPTSFKSGKGFPVRVPSVRADREGCPARLSTASEGCPARLGTASECSPARLSTASEVCPARLGTASEGCPARLGTASEGCPARLSTASEGSQPAPSRTQYLDNLCRLRKISLAQNLPSAFVIALNLLRVIKESQPQSASKARLTAKKSTSANANVPTTPVKRNINVRNKQAQKLKLNSKNRKSLRRTRSMGSLSQEPTTPKKAKIKERKASSERKPHLRSDSKKHSAETSRESPNTISDTANNNKLNLVVKNLSSPLESCHVKKILEEQWRIEQIIKQEQSDMELARKMDAELNGGRGHLRRAAVKRQVTINYALRPAKKLKVQ